LIFACDVFWGSWIFNFVETFFKKGHLKFLIDKILDFILTTRYNDLEEDEKMAQGDSLFTVTDETFQKEVLEAEQPTFVDFWASWCGPCRMIGPIFEELSGEYSGRVKFAKVNVDENPRTPANYGVRGIPTLIMFKGGKPVEQVVGAVPKSQLESVLKKVL
jgi:thioredoxin 1